MEIRNKDDWSVSRRMALKIIGVSSTVGSVTTDLAEAATTTYSGSREREFQPSSDGNFWTQESWFHCDNLENDYGVSSFHVSKDKPLPRHAIPEQHRNPDESFTITYSDSCEIAELQEFESTYQDSTSYSGPKFVFKSNKENPSPSDLGEPQAPINVGWTWGSASSIEGTMESNGWNSRWTSDFHGLSTEGFNDPRWIIVKDGSGDLQVKKTVSHIAKEIRDPTIPVINDTWSFDQWHIRTFNISDTNDEFDVIGQVHHDPWDHGKFDIDDGLEEIWPSIDTTPNWGFSTARRVVANDWQSWGSSVSVLNIGNKNDFNSSGGNLSKINQP